MFLSCLIKRSIAVGRQRGNRFWIPNKRPPLAEVLRGCPACADRLSSNLETISLRISEAVRIANVVSSTLPSESAPPPFETHGASSHQKHCSTWYLVIAYLLTLNGAPTCSVSRKSRFSLSRP